MVTKGEIACFEQHGFKKLSAAEMPKSVYMRERVKGKNASACWKGGQQSLSMTAFSYLPENRILGDKSIP